MVSSVFTALVAVYPAIANAASAPRVVKMPVAQKRDSGLLVKRDPFAISMQNFIPYGEYFVTASIGTPAQTIELIVDTGSSDIWMFGTGSCTSTSGESCAGGEFDFAKSTTAAYTANGVGKFKIQYETQGSYVDGSYFTDVISIGGVQVTNQTMAVATKAADVPSGIMGIGLAVNEAGVSEGLGKYSNLPVTLAAQKKIASQAFSLYLDDISTSTGSILWGGYDEAKFKGDLKMMPIQVDSQSGTITSFTVSWTSLGVATSSGDHALSSPDFVYGAVLDTGTTLTYLPTALYDVLAKYFSVESSGGSEDLTLIDCNYGKQHPGQLVYGLGGSNGVQIAVDFDELAVPIYSNRNGKQLKLKNGQPACQFGLSDAGNSYSILFGQTFLRSAYVLYDLQNLQIGVAQTIFGESATNVVEYTGDPTSNRIETDSTGPTVTYAMTAASSVLPGAGGGYGSYTYLVSGASVFGSVGSITGGFPGVSSAAATEAAVSIVTTTYDLASFTYPGVDLQTAYPTTIPAGPTGKIGTGANGDGSPFNAGQGSGGSGSSATTAKSGGGSSDAGTFSPAFAMAGALVFALLTTMFML